VKRTISSSTTPLVMYRWFIPEVYLIDPMQ